MKRVVVLLRRGPLHRRTQQGLRAAVGYLSAGLQVEVLLLGPAVALLDGEQWPAAVRRPLQMLLSLGHKVRAVAPDEPLAGLSRAQPVVVW